MLGPLAFKAIAATVILAVLGGAYWRYSYVMNENEELEKDNLFMNGQVKTANTNLATLANLNKEQADAAKAAQKRREQRAREDAKRIRSLQSTVARLGVDPGAVAAINSRLRLALERINGSPFDDSSGLPEAGQAGDASNRRFCFDFPNTISLVTDFERIADFVEVVYE